MSQPHRSKMQSMFWDEQYQCLTTFHKPFPFYYEFFESPNIFLRLATAYLLLSWIMELDRLWRRGNDELLEHKTPYH